MHPGERYPFKAGQCIHSCHVMGNFFSDLSNSRSSGFLHLMAIFIRYLLRRIAASDSDRPLVSGGGVHAGHVMASTNTGSSCNLQLAFCNYLRLFASTAAHSGHMPCHLVCLLKTAAHALTSGCFQHQRAESGRPR